MKPLQTLPLENVQTIGSGHFPELLFTHEERSRRLSEPVALTTAGKCVTDWFRRGETPVEQEAEHEVSTLLRKRVVFVNLTSTAALVQLTYCISAFSHTAPLESFRRMSGTQCISESSISERRSYFVHCLLLSAGEVNSGWITRF